MTATAICPAASVQDGTRLIPFAALKDAANGKGEFQIEAGENNILNFRTGASARNVLSLDVSEFPPAIAIPANVRTLSFQAAKFLDALESVAGAMSTDEARYVINGVCLEIGADAARLIATDGRRLHVAELPDVVNDAETLAKIASAEAERLQAHAALDAAHNELAAIEKVSPPVYRLATDLPKVYPARELYEKVSSEDVKLAESRVRAREHAATKCDETLQALKSAAQIRIPAKAVKAILSMPIDRKTDTALTVAAWMNKETPMTHIAAGDFSLTTKQIEGNFPNYRQVIPNDTLCAVSVAIPELRAAIKQAATACTEKSNSVKLHLENNLLTVTGKSDGGEARAQLAVDYHDKELVIAFDPKYLLGVLDGAEVLADKITANFIDELSPGVFTAGNWKAVVMPMRMS